MYHEILPIAVSRYSRLQKSKVLINTTKYLVSFFDLLIVSLILNLELFKVNEMKSFSQLFLSYKYNVYTLS